MDSLRLPWEVIERVIDYSAGRLKTLCSLALTCRQLRPRSHVVMFRRIQLESGDDVSEFIAFLLANPKIPPLVHTLVITPLAFGPSLLYVLPNLSSIECVDTPQLGKTEGDDNREKRGDRHDVDQMPLENTDYMHPRTGADVWVRRSLVVHHSSLASFKRLGAHVRTLRLDSVSFPTLLSFAQVLEAFASVTRLTCKGVKIEAANNNTSQAALERVTQRLSERMRLKELVIDSFVSRRIDSSTLLFDSRLAPSTVEKLVVLVEVGNRFDPAFPLSSNQWRQLEYLVLQLSDHPRDQGRMAKILKRFQHASRLREVLIEWRGWTPALIVEHMYGGVNSSSGSKHNSGYYQPFAALEHALLKFPQPGVKFILAGCADAKMLTFWMHELEKHLAMLLAHGGTVTADFEGLAKFTPQHHDSVQALVVSPNSKWVATGSLDSTVILWSAVNGTVVQRWVPHSYKPVNTLAFSPDSRYIVSGGDDGKAVVWNFISSSAGSTVATLEGHAEPILISAWSPDGSTIATGANDGTARLWDTSFSARTTQTFRQRACIQLKTPVVSLAFSPDGSRLACTSRRGECCIMDNVSVSGMLPEPPRNPSTSKAVDDDDKPRSRLCWRRPHSRTHDTRSTAAFQPPTDGRSMWPWLGTEPCAYWPAINGNGVVPVGAEWAGVFLRTGDSSDGRREFTPMREVSFSPNGTLVLGVSTATTTPLLRRASQTGLRTSRAARLTPRAKYLNAVHVWTAADGVERFKLAAHEHTVGTARFSSCGRFIASADMDGTVRVWSLKIDRYGSPCECVATLSEHGSGCAVEHVAFSLDGRTLSSGASDGSVVIRHMRDIVPSPTASEKDSSDDIHRSIVTPHAISTASHALMALHRVLGAVQHACVTNVLRLCDRRPQQSSVHEVSPANLHKQERDFVTGKTAA